MIIDTTYILPLAGIGVKAYLLRAAAEGSARVSLNELKLSMISLFELQAKAAKLGDTAGEGYVGGTGHTEELRGRTLFTAETS